MHGKNAERKKLCGKHPVPPFEAEVAVDKKGTVWFASSIPIFKNKKKKTDIFCG